ncbi:type IV pilus assembly PilZ [Klebsiella michiganensis]|uniref:Type IV pilus assembly PilZ n=1 Tax=Klebsiella michiganensis TaxID=1134687 RepID=A0A7H4M6Q7_9ENTR|nr:type IV pilus assembly PilZ [Klebsiella michiganensis]
MTEGTIKTSKYEIIAIFREELRKQAEIEVFVNNKSTITQLTRVDFAEFHISTTSKIPAGIKLNLFCIAIQGKSSFALR